MEQLGEAEQPRKVPEPPDPCRYGSLPHPWGWGRELSSSWPWLHKLSPTPQCLINSPTFSASPCLFSILLSSEAFHRPTRTSADVCVL